MIKKRMNGERGITLVALTVTIVIMAILVAVVVKVSTDNDLIDTALNATDQFDQAAVFQALSNILVSERSVYENGFITEQQMWDNIEQALSGNTDVAKELKQYGALGVYPETRLENGAEKTEDLVVTVGNQGFRIEKDTVKQIDFTIKKLTPSEAMELVQSVESGLNGVDAMLQHMIYLCNQAENATYTELDIKSMQMEIKQLKEEINNWLISANYHGDSIFDGECYYIVDAKEGEYPIQLSKTDTTILGIEDIDLLTAFHNHTIEQETKKVEKAIEKITSIRAYLGALQNRLENSLKYETNNKNG